MAEERSLLEACGDGSRFVVRRLRYSTLPYHTIPHNTLPTLPPGAVPGQGGPPGPGPGALPGRRPLGCHAGHTNTSCSQWSHQMSLAWPVVRCAPRGWGGGWRRGPPSSTPPASSRGWPTSPPGESSIGGGTLEENPGNEENHNSGANLSFSYFFHPET